MRIPSEFYLEELFHLMRGINLQIDQGRKEMQEAGRRHSLLTFFMPWRAKELNESLLEKAQETLRLTGVLTDISRKIMDAEGRDEDGQMISLQEMIELTCDEE